MQEIIITDGVVKIRIDEETYQMPTWFFKKAIKESVDKSVAYSEPAYVIKKPDNERGDI